MTPRDALERGDLAALGRLLDTIPEINALDEHGWTLLKTAAGRGDLAAVTLLVQKGADVFATGADRRTAYLVALAAGHRGVVRFLRQAEDQQGGDVERISSRQGEQRSYCRAVELRSLRAFQAWPAPSDLTDDDILFLHHDLTVSRSVIHGDDVVFAETSDDWASFCRDTPGFRVPTDEDLMHDRAAAEAGASPS